MDKTTWREEFDKEFLPDPDYFLLTTRDKKRLLDFIETQISIARAEIKAQCLAVIPPEQEERVQK